MLLRTFFGCLASRKGERGGQQNCG